MAVRRLVRGARHSPGKGRADGGRRLHRGAHGEAGVGEREAAPGGAADAVRLAGGRPGRALQSRELRAGPEARGQERQDAGALSAEEARGLLDRIDLSTLAGLRDLALIGVLVFSFARVSAAVSMRTADYYTQGKRSFFRVHEKGGRYNVVLAHHLAQEYVDAYLEAAELEEDRKRPLFRSCAVGRQDRLEGRAMTRATALWMIKRRVRQAGQPAEIYAHSFRGTGITEYLRNGGDLEVAAAHHAAL